MDFDSVRVTVADREVRLTPAEYRLLRELARNVGEAVTHDHLLEAVWGSESKYERDYLRLCVGVLRSKLESVPNDPDCIVDAPGIGYRLQTKAPQRRRSG